MKELVLSALGPGATVVTANRRLQRTWRSDFDLAQQAEGLRAWPTPAGFSRDDWLMQAYYESFSSRRHQISTYSETRGKVERIGSMVDYRHVDNAQQASQG